MSMHTDSAPMVAHPTAIPCGPELRAMTPPVKHPAPALLKMSCFARVCSMTHSDPECPGPNSIASPLLRWVEDLGYGVIGFGLWVQASRA